MTKSDLIERLSASFQHLSSKEVESAIREILEQMAGTLQSGERIEIRGFGSFEVRIHEPRVAHNPKTGEQVNLSRRRVVHFKPGVELRDRVNSFNYEKENVQE